MSGKQARTDTEHVLDLGPDAVKDRGADAHAFIVRNHAVARRSKGHSESIIRTGGLVVNVDTRTVEIDGQPLHLTGKEYGILELLSLRKGTTLTKGMFLNHLYGGMDEPDLKIIDVFICKLRKKLTAATGDDKYIRTVRGRGYVLHDPVERPASARTEAAAATPGADTANTAALAGVTPEAAACVAAAVAQAVPASAGEIFLAVANVVPDAAADIAASVTDAVPDAADTVARLLAETGLAGGRGSAPPFPVGIENDTAENPATASATGL